MKVEFKGYDGNVLKGEVDLPEGEIKYYALYASCFTCTINYRSTKSIAKVFKDNGIALLRFDFTGLGASEGDFSESNFSSNLENLRLAYKFMEERFEAPKMFVGHSLGGAALVRLYNEFPKVQALAIVASPDGPGHLADKLHRIEERAIENGVTNANIGGIQYEFKPQFFEDLREQEKYHDLSSITKPILVLYSPDDDTISWEHVIKNFTDTRGHKNFITLNNVGHLMSKEKDAQYVGKMILNWAESYL